jgi:Fe-S-cluster containining protein
MHFPENVSRLCGKKRFSFRCHPNVTCFTECCRELELALAPYDVLCLCKELQISSAEFIDRYVVMEQDERGGFPSLYLGMVDDGRASCPFISKEGCKVYNSRPGACRAYPVGRGVTLDANGTVREICVLVHEEHCQGFSEPHSHNVAEWFKNQGLTEHNTVNDELLSLLYHDQAHQGTSLTQEEKDTFLLALYKLDEFRKMVASPAFYDKFMLSKEERQTVLADDLHLLGFGIRWLTELLFAKKHEQRQL